MNKTVFLLAWAALGLIGCAEDEIQRYRIPKAGAPPRVEASGNRRLMAAIVAREDRTWFLKVEGPEGRVAGERERFESFVRSLRFAPELTWTLPAGWQVGPGSGMRYATLKLAGAPPLELTVIALGREASSVLANVNRWREQLGLAPVAEGGLAEFTRAFQTADRTPGTLVFLSTGGGGAAAGPSSRPFQYTLPEGWKEVESQGMRAASFRISEEDRMADVSVVPLAGSAGTLLSNVNRWRGQAGLEPIEEAELARGLRDIDLNGAPAKYVAIQGPESCILAIVLVRGGKTWFFKMQGPAGLVERQQPAFDAFVRSIKFTS